MKNWILVVLALLMAGCAAKPELGDPCISKSGQDGIIGSKGGCMVCSVGVATTTPSGNCSDSVQGVSCCVGGTTSGTGGQAYCSPGNCYSYYENICCPSSARYACNGRCYSYSGGGGCSSYRTTCY